MSSVFRTKTNKQVFKIRNRIVNPDTKKIVNCAQNTKFMITCVLKRLEIQRIYPKQATFFNEKQVFEVKNDFKSQYFQNKT